MVEVDGTKYISEKEFDEAVFAELHVISEIAARAIAARAVSKKTISLSEALVKADAIAEAYHNLWSALFSKKEKVSADE